MARFLPFFAALLLLLPLLGCDEAGGFIGSPPPDDDDLGADDDDDAADDDDTGPVDADGDGFDSDEDCDDSDPDAFPGGDEGDVADGVDNDCSGLADDRPVCAGVDGAYGTIQQGIDDIPDGFNLLICPGTYAEHLDVTGRNIGLVSAEGPEVTIVDGQDSGRTLRVVGSSDLYVQGLMFRGGTADYGGAAVCSGSTLDLVGNIVTASVATVSGGGFYSDGCQVDLVSNLFVDNLAEMSGGGVHLRDTGGTFSDNTVQANTSFDGGGLYAFDGSMTISDNSFIGNVATTTDENTHGAGSGGGGVWVRGSPVVTGNVIQNNTSSYNGGGLFILQGSASVSGNLVNGNHCDEDGGGVYTNHSNTLFSGNTVTANTASDDAGGLRVYIGWMDIVDNVFEFNTAGDDGGALKMSHSSNLVQGNYFEGNACGDAGGALELDNETADVLDNTFIGNSASRGGGLHSWRNEGQFDIRNNHFEDNAASNCGGGLAFDNDPHLITVSDITVIGNQAVDGGAVCINEAFLDDGSSLASNVLFRNVVFAGNSAADDGGGFYVKRGHVELRFTTLHDNSAGTASGLAIKVGGSADVNNTILSGHGGDTFVVVEDDGTIEFSWNDLWDNDGTFWQTGDPVGEDGNMAGDPDFVDPAGGDFRLGTDSACIDAGDPGISDVDGSRADMGAHGGPYGS